MREQSCTAGLTLSRAQNIILLETAFRVEADPQGAQQSTIEGYICLAHHTLSEVVNAWAHHFEEGVDDSVAQI